MTCYSERRTLSGTVTFTTGTHFQFIGGGHRFYGRIPKGLYPKKGDIVTLTARVRPVYDVHNYFKYPTKGLIQKGNK